jgi:hypothetical protein|tara:strand:- start:16 stop:357 length:342 start_codon:yes stop_codon:yes gene_type:complete
MYKVSKKQLVGDTDGTLLTKELRAELPPLYSSEELSEENTPVIAKFFTPDSSWTWYACEFDGKDTFFGLVDGHEKELGYFSLNELESLRGPFGLPVERDIYWTEKSLHDVQMM